MGSGHLEPNADILVHLARWHERRDASGGAEISIRWAFPAAKQHFPYSNAAWHFNSSAARRKRGQLPVRLRDDRRTTSDQRCDAEKQSAEPRQQDPPPRRRRRVTGRPLLGRDADLDAVDHHRWSVASQPLNRWRRKRVPANAAESLNSE